MDNKQTGAKRIQGERLGKDSKPKRKSKKGNSKESNQKRREEIKKTKNCYHFQETQEVEEIAYSDEIIIHDLFSRYRLAKRNRGNNGGGKHKTDILDCVCAFDIETTTIAKDINFMYIWQFCIDGQTVIYGRRWYEFKQFIDAVSQELGETTKLIIYVHNLSYEFQYLKGVFDFHASGAEDSTVFATDLRKVAKCDLCGNIEMRCSYFLSNMGLDGFCKKWKVLHQKQSGAEFDYLKTRYPWTPLTEKELRYCFNDVIGLCEAIHKQLDAYGDTLHTIPLTKTGYIRRTVKRALHPCRYRIQETIPPYECFMLLMDAYRGGNTHANRYKAGQIIENVKSMDRSSSYPDVMVNMLFPMGQWKQYKINTPQQLAKALERPVAYVMRIELSNVRLREIDWPCPYLSFDKCEFDDDDIYYLDNGRILEASHLYTAVTDVDFSIINDEYEFDDIAVLECWGSGYAPLPKQLIDCTNNLYQKKTALKNIDGMEVEYMKSKEDINSEYGMCCTVPIKADIHFDGLEWSCGSMKTKADYEEKKKDFFISYAWGVWVSAWARLRLEDGLRIVCDNSDSPADNFMYTDTDSVKYHDDGTGRIEKAFEDLNSKLKSDSISNCAYATDKHGITHYMGVYEVDGTYDRFITLGAKRYAYEEEGQLHITVSGVSKNAGAKELGKLEHFKEGFLFQNSGKTSAAYYDEMPQKELYIDDNVIELTPCIVISDTTYLMSLSESYKNLLQTVQNVRYNNDRQRR